MPKYINSEGIIGDRKSKALIIIFEVISPKKNKIGLKYKYAINSPPGS